MKRYYEAIAEHDERIAWQKLCAVALGVGLCAQVVIAARRATRPPIHLDVGRIAEMPAERIEGVSADLLNAIGMAREVAIRVLRLDPDRSPEDQAWVLNRMVPALAKGYETEAKKVVELTRRLQGRVSVEVKSVTPVQDHLPYQIDVVVNERLEGDYVKAMGEGEGKAMNKEFRLSVVLVASAKTVQNRDALLVKSIRLTRGGA